MLSTSIGGITLDCCIYNASGPKTGHVSDLVNISKSASGAVLSKSATLKSQRGNELPRLQKIELAKNTSSINSEGLPNSGIDYFIGEKVVSAVAQGGKPYIVSISGLKLENNLEMLTRIANAKLEGAAISAVELNLACPNIPGKPTIAYDFDQMKTILAQVTSHSKLLQSGLPLGIKLAPYFDMPHYAMAAEIINAYKDRIRFVVAINTIGNALHVDGHKEMACIAPKSGFGGLGGGLVKQVALANVRQLSQRLDPAIDIIGVGGVSSGMDAFELILCGASAVQVATCHWLEGPACFGRISKELCGIMKKKGYSSIQDFKGKLKDFDRKLTKAAIDGSEEATSSPSSSISLVSLPWVLLAIMVPILAVLLQREFMRQ
mmetsp:Transcript_35282/g.69211  ORF Transcript_35282/g.69211 Transcript_35282/m.69211 type:complete len:377 (+) Transcript_35282:22-1152(+)